jgi:hypothetical protein
MCVIEYKGITIKESISFISFILFIRWRRVEVHRQLQPPGPGQQPTCRDPHLLTSQMILKIVEVAVLPK